MSRYFLLVLSVSILLMLKLYSQIDTLHVDGRQRLFSMYFPESYSAENQYPLVLVLHGYANFEIGGNFGDDWYEIEGLANEENFIVCYPFGTFDQGGNAYFWNAGGNFELINGGVDDIHFLNVMLDTIFARFPINHSLVFVTGHSNGAMMTYRVALEMSDRISAAAPVAGFLAVGMTSGPVKSIPIMHIHGTDDPTVPWEGGGPYTFPPIQWTINNWLNWNGCGGVPDTVYKSPGVTGITWQSLSGNADVTLFKANGMRHDWPRVSNCNWFGSQYIWEFFNGDGFTQPVSAMEINTDRAIDITQKNRVVEISFADHVATSLELKLYAINGRLIHSAQSEALGSGMIFTLNEKEYPEGIYIMSISTNTGNYSYQIPVF